MTILDRGRGATSEHERNVFTGREPYLEGFRRVLDAPESSGLRVLVFHGVDGVGKSALIERLGRELDERKSPVPHARFNVENLRSPTVAAREVLLRLRSDLEAKSRLSFPRFDDLLAVLLAAEGGEPPALVKSNPTLMDTFDLVMSLQPIPRDKVGKFLETKARISKTAERLYTRPGGREDIAHLLERGRRGDPTLTDELIDRFADDLIGGLPARPGKACRGVLFFDTLETLWKGSESGRSVQARRLDGWLRQLARKVRRRGVLIVVAGRDELRWADDEADWTAAIGTHRLGGLSRADAQVYLSRRAIGLGPPHQETPLQTAILDACSGDPGPKGEILCHPLFLALCADIVDSSRENTGADPLASVFTAAPSDHDQVARKLADQFLKSLPDERWELWLKELSMTPAFDERAALEIDSGRHHNLGRDGWKRLCRFSILESQPDGHFRIHKTMRDVLRTQVEDYAANVHAWFRDHWSGHSERALAFFHRWSLDPEGTLLGWLEAHKAALREGRLGQARALLDDWSEIPLDGLDRQRLGDALWARTHVDLGNAFFATPIAPRAPALNAAIVHYELALRVYTESNFLDWAATQHNLGAAYWKLPTGDHGANIRRAIECYKAALGVRTEKKFPVEWAATQNNLGLAYMELPTGDHATNIRRAIECYEAALRVRTESSFPLGWAATQNNLGAAYWNLPDGDRGDNLRRAIDRYKSALRVYTQSAFPVDWAMTQNNLGAAYSDLPTGDRGDNLRRAIECYKAALEVRTESAFPVDWAGTQLLLASAYWNLPTGDRGTVLRRAVFHGEAALRVYTETEFPAAWATTQLILGMALREIGRFEESLVAFEASARGYRSAGDTERVDEASREAEKTQRMKDSQDVV